MYKANYDIDADARSSILVCMVLVECLLYFRPSPQICRQSIYWLAPRRPLIRIMLVRLRGNKASKTYLKSKLKVRYRHDTIQDTVSCCPLQYGLMYKSLTRQRPIAAWQTEFTIYDTVPVGTSGTIACRCLCPECPGCGGRGVVTLQTKTQWPVTRRVIAKLKWYA